MGLILILVLLILLFGIFPAWPHAKRWGYAPTGIVVLLLLGILLFVLLGYMPLV